MIRKCTKILIFFLKSCDIEVKSPVVLYYYRVVTLDSGAFTIIDNVIRGAKS